MSGLDVTGKEWFPTRWNMAYLNETRNKVVTFLKKHGSCTKTELRYLGKKVMQVTHSSLEELLDDLKREGRIKITEVRIGKKVFKEITWRKEAFSGAP